MRTAGERARGGTLVDSMLPFTRVFCPDFELSAFQAAFMVCITPAGSCLDVSQRPDMWQTSALRDSDDELGTPL